jgi:hypothetical protein
VQLLLPCFAICLYQCFVKYTTGNFSALYQITAIERTFFYTAKQKNLHGLRHTLPQLHKAGISGSNTNYSMGASVHFSLSNILPNTITLNSGGSAMGWPKNSRKFLRIEQTWKNRF